MIKFESEGKKTSMMAYGTISDLLADTCVFISCLRDALVESKAGDELVEYFDDFIKNRLADTVYSRVDECEKKSDDHDEHDERMEKILEDIIEKTSDIVVQKLKGREDK